MEYPRPLLIVLLPLLAACGDDDAPGTDAAPPDVGADVELLDAAVQDAGPSDAAPQPAPEVTTASGPVRGLVTRSGTYSFFGIPYAAPAEGARRFRPPAPAEPWTATLDATAPRSFCPQAPNALLPARGEESEDCLEVNVFTPDLAPAEPLPVMVFFYGGAFTFGAGNSALYDGSGLAAHRVVVVTLNYRIGLLGFLAHPALDAEEGTSGMYGILDQQAALRWVQDNVAAFGGDATRVTIFGESAGAVSVCVHYFAPGSRGLFARAISESGSCLDGPAAVLAPADGDAARSRGIEIAQALGCPGAEEAAAACLRALPADALRDAIPGTSLPGRDPAYGALSIGPCIDGVVLPSPPSELIAAGRHAGVPYILGTNLDEGTLFSDDATLTTDAEYEAAVRALLPEQADAALAAFPVAEHGSPLAAYDAFFRDVVFVCPTRALAGALAAGGTDTRVYRLEQTNASVETMGLGVAHGIELLYVFGNFPVPFSRASEAERSVRDAVQGYWTRFAATGDPDGDGALPWPGYDETEPHLVLADPVSTASALERAQCAALAVGAPTR